MEKIYYGSTVVAEVPIEQTSIRKFTLMKEDYVRLDFTLDSPIMFRIGSHFDDEIFGRFVLRKEQLPKYQTATGGYRYELEFEAEYMHLGDSVYTLVGEHVNDGTLVRSASEFSLTADLYGQLDSWIKSVRSLGFDITFDPDVDTNFAEGTVKSPKEVECMKFVNVDLLKGLKDICDKWEVEYWFWRETRNNVEKLCLKVGKCEFGTSPIEMELGENVASMSVSDSRKTFANRIFAYGGTTNIAYEYRRVLKSILTGWCKAYYRRDNTEAKVTNDYDYCFPVFTASTENGALLKKMFSGTEKERSGSFYENSNCTLLNVGAITNVSAISFKLTGIVRADFSNSFAYGSINYNVRLVMKIYCGDTVILTKQKDKYSTVSFPNGASGYPYHTETFTLSDFDVTWMSTNPISGNFKITFETTATSSYSGDSASCRFHLYYGSSYSCKYSPSVCPITMKDTGGNDVTIYAYLFDHLSDIQRTFEYSHAEITEHAVTWNNIQGFSDNVIVFGKSDNFEEASRYGIRGVQFGDNVYQAHELKGILFDDDVEEVDSKDVGSAGTSPHGTFLHAKQILIESANINIPQRLYVSPYDDPSSLLRLGSQRLRLPKDVGDYVQTSEANDFLMRKEIVVIFNKIFPKLRLEISGVEVANCTEEQTFEGENDNVQWQYKQYWVQLKYIDDNTLLTFDKSGMIDGETLRLRFVAPGDFDQAEEGYDGLLSGMTFDLQYMPNGDYIGSRHIFDGQPCFKILRNDTYGAKLPSETLCPQVGDFCTLEGVNLRFFNGTSVYNAAELKLKEIADAYLQALSDGQFTFACTMLSDWMKNMAILPTEPVIDENYLAFELASPSVLNRGYICEGRTVRILHDSLRTSVWAKESKTLLHPSAFSISGSWYTAEAITLAAGCKIVAESDREELAFFNGSTKLISDVDRIEYVNSTNAAVPITVARRMVCARNTILAGDYDEYASETLERTFFVPIYDSVVIPNGYTISVNASSASSGVVLLDSNEDVIYAEESAGETLQWNNNTGNSVEVLVSLTNAACDTSYIVMSIENDIIAKTYERRHGTESRVIGYKMKLDCPYDSAEYVVGETEAYSRLDQIEKEISKS